MMRFVFLVVALCLVVQHTGSSDHPSEAEHGEKELDLSSLLPKLEDIQESEDQLQLLMEMFFTDKKTDEENSAADEIEERARRKREAEPEPEPAWRWKRSVDTKFQVEQSEAKEDEPEETQHTRRV